MNKSITAAEHFTAIPLPDSIDHLTGPLRFRMTNDILFHILFETNKTALRGLICSLLKLQDSDIHSIEIKNPIEFGNTIFSKGFVLDLKLLLNNNISINVEMQVLKSKNWPERSLSYLCRSFDKLNAGDDYYETNTAIHIGILDYDLFPEHEARFYTTYHLADDVTHRIYTGKFQLSVLYLNHVDKATEDDLAYHLDYWARFFKATTWEELKMQAENNPIFTEATKTVFTIASDNCAQTMIEAYEEYEKLYNTVKREAEEARIALAEERAKNAEKDAALTEKDSALAEKDSALAEKDSALAENQERIAFLEAELARLQSNK